jgi:hypothetical protein
MFIQVSFFRIELRTLEGMKQLKTTSYRGLEGGSLPKSVFPKEIAPSSAILGTHALD